MTDICPFISPWIADELKRFNVRSDIFMVGLVINITTTSPNFEDFVHKMYLIVKLKSNTETLSFLQTLWSKVPEIKNYITQKEQAVLKRQKNMSIQLIEQAVLKRQENMSIQLISDESDSSEEIVFVELLEMQGTINENKKSLPILAHKKDLLRAIADNQILIIECGTGSGKTTQLPKYLHEAGYTKNGRKIGCTQLRTEAAMSVSKTVSEEMKVKLGNEVGYSTRFENHSSEKTIIKYMTDGILLREILSDTKLDSYSVVMIDEAHERTINTDILLGLMKDIVQHRKDLKLLISSTTSYSDEFSAFFNHATIFSIPGRRYGVNIYCTEAIENDLIEASVDSILQLHANQPAGDIMVFLPGQKEIEKTNKALTDRMRNKDSRLIIHPVYANLPTDIKDKIFERTPEGARKVILATNIAETSLTIDGIIYVIDSGYCKQSSFDPRTGVESLVETKISKAMADQRTERAGRVAAGKCFRLYTESEYNGMDTNSIPEIQRTDLANVVLLLKGFGIADLNNFKFMNQPPREALMLALHQLQALQALDSGENLTKLGKTIVQFPCNPMTSKMIINSQQFKCTKEILTIASMLSVSRYVFYLPKDKKSYAESAHKKFVYHPQPLGDHLTLLNVYKSWANKDYSYRWCNENYIQFRAMKKAKDVREQLARLLIKFNIEMSSSNDTVAIRKAITAGFFYNMARSGADGFKTVVHQQLAQIHPDSCLNGGLYKSIIYNELVLTSEKFMRHVIVIENKWLSEVAPSFYSDEGLDVYDRKIPKQTGKSRQELYERPRFTV